MRHIRAGCGREDAWQIDPVVADAAGLELAEMSLERLKGGGSKLKGTVGGFTWTSGC